MLILKFQAGSQQYAVEAARVVEVIPWVALRPVPHAPGYVKGLFNYRGQVVPVVDLPAVLGAAACSPRLSTRILVVRRDGESALLGLLVERLNDLQQVAADEWTPSPVPLSTAPFLGPVHNGEGGLVQLIHVDRVAPEALAGGPQEVGPS